MDPHRTPAETASEEAPRPPIRRGREAARWIAASAIAGLFAAHFLIVSLGLFPDNPVSHQYKLERAAYMEPLFSQNWSLFAPNPINSNMNVLYRFEAYRGGEMERSEWVDAMTPLVEAKRAHFWSPVQRITKFLTGSMQGVNQANNDAYEFIQKTDSLKADSVAADQFYRQVVRGSMGHQALAQYGESVFQRHAGADVAAYDSVLAQYSIHVAKFPRFSKRDLDYFDLENYEFSQRPSEPFRLRGLQAPALPPATAASGPAAAPAAPVNAAARVARPATEV